MDTKLILTDLRAQRDRVDQAIAALESLGGILNCRCTTGFRRQSLHSEVQTLHQP